MAETMYTCRYCGKPTTNFHPYQPRIAEILGIPGVSICDECYGEQAKLRAWENEQYETDNLICPWCGYENINSWELSDGEDDYECPACGEVFTYERVVDVHYTSKKRAEDYPGDDAI